MSRRSELCLVALSLPAAVGLHLGLRRLLSWLRRPRSRIVVKLGGSACTDKAAFETVHTERLQATATQLAQTRPANGEDRVLLHGAGSFGHFQARQYGLKHGASHPDHEPIGFALARSSVTRLNGLILSALIQCGLPAVGMPAFPRWRKRRNVMGSGAALCADVARAWRAGLLPVLHGDVVFDEAQGCAILSGDEIIIEIARLLRPRLVVFLTDVKGVYDRPPQLQGATLLPELRVGRGGAVRVVRASADSCTDQIATSTAAHDVTGGLAAKLAAAATIAARGIPVIIVQAGTEHAAAALAGERPAVGTVLMREGAVWPPRWG